MGQWLEHGVCGKESTEHYWLSDRFHAVSIKHEARQAISATFNSLDYLALAQLLSSVCTT